MTDQHILEACLLEFQQKLPEGFEAEICLKSAEDDELGMDHIKITKDDYLVARYYPGQSSKVDQEDLDWIVS